jgi:ABC-2 type transport system permease protein
LPPSLAIARHELRILRRGPWPLILLTLMPLILMALFEPVFANGARQSVPGMTVLFAFFVVGQVGYAFFREHAWGTWERLRATELAPRQIMIGKVLLPLAIYAVQFAVLFAAGWALFGLQVRGSLLGLAAIGAALALALTAFGLALVAVCQSLMAVQTLVNLGALVFAGAGGALVPFALLPGWVRAVSPYTPGYWAMEGFTRAIDGPGGAGALLGPVAILLGWAALFAALATWRLRFEETKTGWA